jgi:hypothetical protein
MGGGEAHIGFWRGNWKEKKSLGIRVMEGGVMLKCSFKK